MRTCPSKPSEGQQTTCCQKVFTFYSEFLTKYFNSKNKEFRACVWKSLFREGLVTCTRAQVAVRCLLPGSSGARQRHLSVPYAQSSPRHDARTLVESFVQRKLCCLRVSHMNTNILHMLIIRQSPCFLCVIESSQRSTQHLLQSNTQSHKSSDMCVLTLKSNSFSDKIISDKLNEPVYSLIFMLTQRSDPGDDPSINEGFYWPMTFREKLTVC